MKRILLAIILIFLVACTKTETYVGNLQVTVDPSHQRCSADSDCMSVPTKCNGCECQGTPINKQFKDLYGQKYADLCNGYTGPVCDLMCKPVALKCINGICGFSEANLTS